MSEIKNLSSRTRIGLIWAGGEAFSRAGMQLVVLIFLARLLTPGDFGVVGVAQVIIGIAYVFGLLGVGPAVVQRTELRADHIRAAWSFSLCFGFSAAALVYLAAPALSAFFNMPKLMGTLQWLALVFPIAGLSVVPESLLQRELKFGTLARIEVSAYFIGFGCVAIILAFLHFGLWALVIGQLVQMTARSLQMMIATRSWPSFTFHWQAFKDLFRFSAGQTAANFANYIATNGDNLIVGKFLGAEPMGIYTRAYQLMLAPALLVGSVLEKVLFPALSKIQKERDLLKRAYRQSNHLLAVIILPTAAAIWLLAPDAIPLGLGAKWSGVVLPLQLFSIGLLWRTGMKVSNSIIRACGAVNIFAICQFSYAISVVVFAWIGSNWGIPGVCLGVLASILGCYVFCAAICFRLTQLRMNEFLLDHLPGFSLCGVVAITGWIALTLVHLMKCSPLVSLIAMVLTIGLVGIAAIAAIPRFFLGAYGEPFKAKITGMLSRKISKTGASQPSNGPSAESRETTQHVKMFDEIIPIVKPTVDGRELIRKREVPTHLDLDRS